MMPHLSQLLLYCSLFFIASCASEPSDTNNENASTISSNVQLLCIPSPYMQEDAPQHDLYFQVGDKKTRIAETQACGPTEANAFVRQHLPANATNLIGGYWAGQGRYFYIIQEENHAAVWEIREYEEEPETLDIQEIAYFEEGRFGRR